MKKTKVSILVTGFLMSACVSQETFVKNNIRYSEFEMDRASCETKAAQEIEVNRSPGAEVAVALLTGVYQTQDANAPARKRNYEACMMQKGYQRIELPPCTDVKDAQENGVGPLSASSRIDVTKNSCVVNDTRGRIIFHKQDDA